MNADSGVEEQGATGNELSPPEATPPIDAAAVWPGAVVPDHDGVIASNTAGLVGVPTFSSSITATMGRVMLYGEASTLGQLPGWRSELGVGVALLRRRALDLDVGGGYEPLGWSGVPELVMRLSGGRTIGGTRVQASAAAGVGAENHERYGELDLAASRAIVNRIVAGLDGRARLDLARGPDDAPTERTWDAQLAGFVSRSFGRFAVIATVGLVGWQMRFDRDQTGAVATLGIAAGL